MLFIFLTVSCVVLGSSKGIDPMEFCFSSSARLPERCTPSVYNGPLYFTPRNGGQRKLLMDNKEAKDPRLVIKPDSVVLTHLTEKDDGTFAVSGSNGEIIDIFSVKILDCASEISKVYGEELEYGLPQKAVFLEFTPFHRLDYPVILWNGTNFYEARVRVEKYKFRMSRLTQADSGFYNFKQKDKTLVSRLRLTVQGNTSYYGGELKGSVSIAYPESDGPWTVTYFPEHGGENVTVIKARALVRNDNPLRSRIQLLPSGFKISHIQKGDSGFFEFRDPAGNVALTSHLTIIESHHAVTYSVVAVACVVSGIIYCVSRKRRCCNSSSTATAQAVQPTAGPNVYYHDANGPAGPGYSAGVYPPQNSKDVVFHDPPATFPGPVGGNQPPGPGYFAPPYPAAYPPQTVNAVVSNEPTTTYSGPVFQDLNQPAGPGFSAPHYSAAFPPPLVNAGTSYDAAAAASGPVGFYPLNMNVSQAEMTPPTKETCAPVSAFGSNILSSDTQPSFELNRLNLSSDLPLNTEQPSTNVNKPNEFNFL
ncbi:uncharacterized protein LOC101174273 [Oryzias latipes]|uniref:uncharacterized protein LOC101174273 n=1 Tax=Oryzias latipes TaxID=8090 RepID=UPI000CE169AC|nr:uncharacterized protein LOC101174273 [Oryzias latipes]